MSVHKFVLRVTDEANTGVRKFAERHSIGVYDAASALILAGLAESEQGAESTWKVEIAETVKLSPEEAASVREFVASSGPSMADFEAMKADRDRLQVEIEEADEARRAAEQRLSFAAEGDPRVTAYAKETSTTYADALDKLVRLGISRAKALDKHAAGKRAG